jgi:hypothetical protein
VIAMLTSIRGFAIVVALTATSTLVACANDGPSDPVPPELINGTWIAVSGPDIFQLTLTDRGSSITGTGTYTIDSRVAPVAVSGSATATGDNEVDFTLTVTGAGVPTTSIEGETTHFTFNGALSEHLNTFVTNSRVGTKVFFVFVRE